MPRMRLLKDTLPAVQEQDPDTALTVHAIRELALNGKIKSVMIGSRRRLINIDSLFDYLATGDTNVEQPEQIGTIRKIRA
jgi:hypothetical protein